MFQFLRFDIKHKASIGTEHRLRKIWLDIHYRTAISSTNKRQFCAEEGNKKKT